jgi:hypothetical protein
MVRIRRRESWLVVRLRVCELLPYVLVALVPLGVFDVIDNFRDDFGVLLLLFFRDALVLQHALPFGWKSLATCQHVSRLSVDADGDACNQC